MDRFETIGSATLYLGDCREILPTLPRTNAIVADPPYGQRVNTNVRRNNEGRTGRYLATGGRIHEKADAYPQGLEGDDQPFDPALILDMADKVLLWGAHKFGERLPAGRWLGWDKMPHGKVKDQGDGELAWTNVNPKAPLRLHRMLWDGLSIAGGYETRVEREGAAAKPRCHPTQKPVDLMTWCIGFLDLQPGAHICDPYMGAGSTGLAAVLGGFRFTGIEMEPRYFDEACRRVEVAEKHRERCRLQHTMFEDVA